MLFYEEKEWKYETYTSIGWRARQTLKISTDDLNKGGTIVDVAVDKLKEELKLQEKFGEVKYQHYARINELKELKKELKLK